MIILICSGFIYNINLTSLYMYIIIVGAFITFMGEILPNHAYLDLSLVGTAHDGSDSVQCHTDLGTCCSEDQGRHRGVWYFPNGDRVPFSADIYEARQVNLHHRNITNTSGIYHCEIPTNAVHDDSDTSVRELAYVGLYASGGKKWEEEV